MATRQTSSGDSVIATMGLVEEEEVVNPFVEAFGEPTVLQDNTASHFPAMKAMYQAEPKVMVMLAETPEWVCINGVAFTIPADEPVLVPFSVEGVLRNQREGNREVKQKNAKLRKLMSYSSANEVQEYIR